MNRVISRREKRYVFYERRECGNGDERAAQGEGLFDERSDRDICSGVVYVNRRTRIA